MITLPISYIVSAALVLFILSGLSWGMTGVDPLMMMARGLLLLRTAIIVMGEKQAVALAEWWRETPVRFQQARLREGA